jgi:coenzyme PQQ precursor peptide PqqA
LLRCTKGLEISCFGWATNLNFGGLPNFERFRNNAHSGTKSRRAAFVHKRSRNQASLRQRLKIWYFDRTETKETEMTWTTPSLIEICVGLEINGYLPAEF